MKNIQKLKTAIRKVKLRIGKVQGIQGLTDEQWDYLAEAQQIVYEALKNKQRNG